MEDDKVFLLILKRGHSEIPENPQPRFTTEADLLFSFSSNFHQIFFVFTDFEIFTQYFLFLQIFLSASSSQSAHQIYLGVYHHQPLVVVNLLDNNDDIDDDYDDGDQATDQLDPASHRFPCRA